MIQIPAHAKVITESRLTLVRAVFSLNDAFRKTGGLCDQIKDVLKRKRTDYAESDHVVGALRAGYARSTIDPVAALAACKAKKIPVDAFLKCCTVRKEALAEHLSKSEIEAVSSAGEESGPSLITEFKPLMAVDNDKLADSLGNVIGKHLSQFETRQAA